jgi:hypothetical protein
VAEHPCVRVAQMKEEGSKSQMAAAVERFFCKHCSERQKNLLRARDALSPPKGPKALTKNTRPFCQQPLSNQRPLRHAFSCQPTRPLYTTRCKLPVLLATYQPQPPSATLSGTHVMKVGSQAASPGTNYPPPHSVSFHCHCAWLI